MSDSKRREYTEDVRAGTKFVDGVQRERQANEEDRKEAA